MKNQDTTNEQLINELESLRRRVSELEESEARFKGTEPLLRESEERFRLLYENAPLGYQSLDENGYLLEVNREWLQVLGYTRDEVIGKWIGDFIAPESLDRLKEDFPKFKVSGEIHGAEFVMLRKDGSWITMAVDGRIGHDTQGQFKQTHCILHDISEIKQFQDALRESRQRYRAVVDNVEIGISLLNPKMEIVEVNKSMKRYFPEVRPACGQICYEHYNDPPRTEPCTYCPCVLTIQDGEVHETITETPSGSEIRNYHVVSSPLKDSDGQVQYVVELVEDITERKRAEEALHRLNRELRAISICNQVLVRARDEQTLLKEICRIVCDEAGYRLAWVGYAENDDAKTIRPVAWSGFDSGYIADTKLSWADDTERGRGPAGTVIRGGKTVYVQDFTTDPQMAPWRGSALQRGYRSGIALPLKDENTEVFGVLLIYATESNAITPEEIRLMEELADDLAFGINSLRAHAERKRAQEAADRANYEWERTFNAISDLVMVLDCQHQILRANKATADALGMTEPELIGKPCFELVHGGKEPPVFCPHSQLLADGEEHSAEVVEPRLGAILDVRVSPLVGQNGQVIGSVHVTRDITERKRVEEALRKRVVALTQPLDDSASIGFSDLFNIEDIQRIQDTFAEATGVASIITEPDGTPITQPSNFCRLCKEIIRKTHKGLANCFKSDAVIGRHNPSGPIVQPCLSGGLWDAGASITIGGKHISNWLIGQVRNEIQDEKVMLQYADEIGADPEEFRKALAEVPIMSLEQFKKVSRALFSFANELSVKAYQNVQQARSITEQKRAEEVLHAREQEFRALAENSPDYIARHDRDGRILYCNPAIQKIAGCSIYELLGKTAADLSPTSDSAQLVQDKILEVVETGCSVESEFVLDHTTAGKQRYYHIRFVPERDRSGKIVSVLSAGRDITALKETERQLRTLLDNFPDMIARFDRECRHTYVNPVISRNFGLPKEDFLGKTFEEINPRTTDTDPSLVELIKRAFEEGVPNSCETKWTLPGGEHVFDTRHVPELDESGEVVSVLGIARDITERKQTERSLNLTNFALNKVSDAAFLIDENARFHYVNEEACRVLGYTRDELLGLGVPDIDPEFPSERWAGHWIELEQLRTHSFESHHKARDGRVFPVEISASFIDYGGQGYNLALVRDITERKRTEEELRQYREHLEDLVRDRTEELERRTQQLETANIRLREADRLKSVFLASMSHELRTPLNSIIGFTGIMLMGMTGNLSEEQQNQLMMVRNSANLLLSLINDVLDIARIEAGKVKLSLERFELGEVVESVVETVSPVTTEKGLDLVWEVPAGIMVVSDKRRVKQILMNIVGNAVKFTEHGNVKISAQVLGDGNLELRFTDTGIGIREQDMNRLFSPFQQIDDSLTKAHEGTGLGLYLCKKLAILLGGDIEVTSTYGKGSEFTVVLPLTYGGAHEKDTDR